MATPFTQDEALKRIDAKLTCKMHAYYKTMVINPDIPGLNVEEFVKTIK